MPLWGNKKQPVTVSPTTTVETTDGAPIGTYTLVKGGGGDNANFGNTAGSRANTDFAMYKANAVFPTMPGIKVGVVPIAVTDLVNPNTAVLTQTMKVDVLPANGGDNYQGTVYANVVFANGYVAENFLVATIVGGGITEFNQVAPSPRGTVFNSAVTAVQFPPSPDLDVKVCNGIGFNNGSNEILYPNANQLLQSQDEVTYIVPAGNTAIAQLTPGVKYLRFPSATGFQLRDGPTDPVSIDITDTRANTTNYETHIMRFKDAYVNIANAVVITNVVSAGLGDGTPSPVAHAGWVVKREGTGGRAGRVHYETLVAMHSLANT
jgi:hypothetical protein